LCFVVVVVVVVVVIHTTRSHTNLKRMYKKILTFDTFYRTSIGVISILAALDMTTVLIRVNDKGMRGYSQGDYAIGLKHWSVQEGDVAVIIDPFENREKVRRVTAKESKFMFNREGKRNGRRRNILVPAAHWWCESDIPDEHTGALDSCAVHERMVEAKVMFKISGASLMWAP
jgi:hypothetical protein